MKTRLGWPTWIGVVAEDLEAQRRFYREVLGLEETAHGEGWVQFGVGGRLFEVIGRTGDPQYASRRYQVGFTVEDIHATRDELTQAGVEALTEVEGGPDSANQWCYFRDPEGNVFEITEWVTKP